MSNTLEKNQSVFAKPRGRDGFGSFAFVLPAVILLAAVFLAPIAYVVVFSFQRDATPTLAGYQWIAGSTLFARVLWTTFQISVTSTAVSVALGYVIALHLASLSARWRTICLALVLLPFWTSILVKSYAFTLILGRDGLVNGMLAWVLGYNPELPLIFNRVGVVIGMANYLVPFVVFPVLANLLAQDRNLLQASAIMGAHPFMSFWRITLPLSRPAIIAGTLICLIMSFGFFVTPSVLGGRQDIMLANLIDLFTRETLNWTVASAIAVVILVISGLIVVALSRIPGAMERT